MLAEWQARQLLLMGSEPEPVNISESSGRFTFTDFSVIDETARPGRGSRTAIIRSASGKIMRAMGRSPSRSDNGGFFDDVAHEPRGVPVAPVGLRHPIAVGAAHQQFVTALGGQGEPGFPLPETVFAFVLAERCSLPGLAAVARQIHPSNARVAAKGDPARRIGRAGWQALAGFDVRQERARRHLADG